MPPKMPNIVGVPVETPPLAPPNERSVIASSAPKSDLGNDPVFNRANPVDFASNGISDDQWLRWLERETNAAWSSGENQIARFKRHSLRKLGDLLPNVEDQVSGVGVLAQFSVNERAQPKHVRVPDFVGGYYTRTKGTMRVEGLS